MGRYFYAVGGNIKASRLSGISTRFYLFMAYVLCGALAPVAGVLLTARLETGEANIGTSLPLDSIAACVIGGVSLRGGTGSLGNVVLGAVFIGLIQNGMDLAQIQSYLQEVVIGVLLILAVVADQLRQFVDRFPSPRRLAHPARCESVGTKRAKAVFWAADASPLRSGRRRGGPSALRIRDKYATAGCRSSTARTGPRRGPHPLTPAGPGQRKIRLSMMIL